MKLVDPGITSEPTKITASQSRPADIFTAAAVPGRSAALDVCVAPSIAAAARGDAAQPAFDRKLSHYRNDIKATEHHNRPPVWTADGRPHPAVTRTLQYAADIASSRNGKHLSAKSLHRRWKHEIQIAFLQRRAAKARAVLPNPSTSTEWLFAGIIDRALHHWEHVPALDGGPPPGPTPLWGSGSAPGEWADVCGFLKPPHSYGRWKVRLHAAFSILHDALGVRPKDQSCHHEVWLHLAFVDHHVDYDPLEGHEQRLLLKERSAPYQPNKERGKAVEDESDRSLSSSSSMRAARLP